MKERKYKEDFGIEMKITDSGREERIAVYKGEYYSFPEKKRFIREMAWRSVIYIVFYLLYMFVSPPSSYCIYVLPFAAAAMLPLAYWMMGFISAVRTPEKMTTVQKEKGIGRVVRSAMGCLMLMLLACTGDLIFMIRSAVAAEELPAFAFLVCAAVSGLASLRCSKAFYAQTSVVNAEEKQEKNAQ